MDSDYKKWDQIYRRYPIEALPWELGRPRKVLVENDQNETGIWRLNQR